VLTFDETIAWTASWYQSYSADSATARTLVDDQIAAFSQRCAALS